MSRRRLRRSTAVRVVGVALAAAVLGLVARDRMGADDPTIGAASALVTTTAPTTTTTAPTTTTTLPTTTTAPPATTTTAPFDVTSLRPSPPAGDPAGLVAQIAAAEGTLRDPAAGTEAIGQAALTQQLAYRMLADHPEWDGAVLAGVGFGYQATVAEQVEARREFLAMHTRPATKLPAWHIVAPAPLEELQAAFQEAQAASGIPWQYLAAINLVETGMGRIRGTSTAGAQGPMQFMPATWAAYGGGGDINSVRDAILGAARYLAANNGVTDIVNALWHYNHDAHYVRGVMLYADLVDEHPLALRAMYLWGVWYRMASGDVYLPVGWTGQGG